MLILFTLALYLNYIHRHTGTDSQQNVQYVRWVAVTADLSCAPSAFASLWHRARGRPAVCLPRLSWPVVVQTPLGPWSPADLFLTLTWGILGVREFRWVQTGSPVRSLGGWRNLDTGRENLCVCLEFAHFPSGVPHPQFPFLERTILTSVNTCRPGWFCLLSFLTVLAAFVHLGT